GAPALWAGWSRGQGGDGDHGAGPAGPRRPVRGRRRAAGPVCGESRMAPGDRFPPERELARQLRVSRTSVRQAMVVLQAQGFVDVRHGEGIFLRRTRGFGESLPKLIERRRRLPEGLEAREALEVKLAELAAGRRTH